MGKRHLAGHSARYGMGTGNLDPRRNRLAVDTRLLETCRPEGSRGRS
jgi:hypothetical protein